MRLQDAEAVAQERTTRAVRFLLAKRGMTQAQLAALLGIDGGNLSRSLLPPGAVRQRWWRHGEIMQMSIIFDVPPGLFFSADVNEEWEARLAQARAERAAQDPDGQGHIEGRLRRSPEEFPMPNPPVPPDDDDERTVDDVNVTDPSEFNIPNEDTVLERSPGTPKTDNDRR